MRSQRRKMHEAYGEEIDKYNPVYRSICSEKGCDEIAYFHLAKRNGVDPLCTVHYSAKLKRKGVD